MIKDESLTPVKPSRKLVYIVLTPLNPTFIYIVKLVFTGVYTCYFFFVRKHRLLLRHLILVCTVYAGLSIQILRANRLLGASWKVSLSISKIHRFRSSCRSVQSHKNNTVNTVDSLSRSPRDSDIRGMFEMNCLLSSSSISTWGTIKINTYLYRAIQYLHNGV